LTLCLFFLCFFKFIVFEAAIHTNKDVYDIGLKEDLKARNIDTRAAAEVTQDREKWRWIVQRRRQQSGRDEKQEETLVALTMTLRVCSAIHSSVIIAQ